MKLQELLTQFDKVKRLKDNSYQCKCPAHQDEKASLTISEEHNKILLHCHAGCSTESILAHVGLTFKDLHTKPAADWKEWLEKSKDGKIEDIYNYLDETGKYLYSKVRLKTKEGKKIVYGMIEGERIKLSIGNTRKVLFNLKNIQEARKTGQTLYLPEGEKDCRTLTKKGLLAATYGGVGDWKKEFAASFEGIDLIVLPDNDVAGQKVANQIVKDCIAYVKSIKKVITSTTEKGDVTDYFEEGHTQEEFQELIEKAEYIPQKEPYSELPEKIYEKEKEVGNITKFVNAPLKLKCGEWNCNRDGVYKWTVDKKTGEKIKLYATRQQILPSGLVENIETGEQKYILSYSLKRNHNYLWKDIRVEPATCCSKTKIIHLSNMGIKVTDQTAKQLINYIDDLYNLNEDILPVKNSISRLGWIGTDFFPYADKMIFDGDIEQEKTVEAMQEAGDFSIWARECKEVRKNLLVRIMMDSCLASVLIEKIGGLCFVLHLWGMSGMGKTVALLVCASLWGKPDTLLSSADATQNYCTNRAAFFRNLPVLIDETQVAASSKENGLDKLIYLMTEGKTRGRLDRNSKERNGKSWACVSVFTGEKPMISGKSGAGAINRVIELELENKLFEDFGHTLEVIRNHYGHAGRKFIEYLKKSNLEDIKEEYQTICKEITECSESTGKQNQSLAFILLADKLAGKCLFEEESPLPLPELIKFLKTEKEVSTSERAYQCIVNWIAANQNYFKEECSTKIYGKIERNYCYFNQNELVKVLHDNNFDFDSVKKEWAAAGYLQKNSQERYFHYTTIFSNLKARYIKIILKNEEQEQEPEISKSGFIKIANQETIPF